MKKMIKNAYAIVTCDDLDQVFYAADMLIEDREIIEIGKNITCEDAEIIDATGKIVYPGMVNTHHHFFQTFVRNLTTVDYPGLSVMDWIDTIYRIFKDIDDEVIYYSSLTAMADLLKHGCTTAFDHQYCYTDKTGKRPVDRQMEAAELLGIRYHAGRGGNTLPRELGSSIPEEMVESTEEFIADCERLIQTYHDAEKFAMKQIVVAPCQPINCYEDTFKESIKLARKYGVKLHTHLGEGESEGIKERTGTRSVEWCEKIGFLGEDVFLAHAWELTDEEYAILGKTKTAVSHCPTPAILGGFPFIDMKKMSELGITVSLGCDGSATNDSSNMLDALRIAYLMQSYGTKQRGGSFGAYDLLKVATINGAKTLGRNDLGSLEVGKAADLFMMNVDGLQYTAMLHDPKNLLARGGITGIADLTMVNGKVVVQDGKLVGIDESKLQQEGEKVCNLVLRKLHPNIWK